MREEIEMECNTEGCPDFIVMRKVPAEGMTMFKITCPNCSTDYRVSVGRKPVVVAKAMVKRRVK